MSMQSIVVIITSIVVQEWLDYGSCKASMLVNMPSPATQSCHSALAVSAPKANQEWEPQKT